MPLMLPRLALAEVLPTLAEAALRAEVLPGMAEEVAFSEALAVEVRFPEPELEALMEAAAFPSVEPEPEVAVEVMERLAELLAVNWALEEALPPMPPVT